MALMYGNLHRASKKAKAQFRQSMLQILSSCESRFTKSVTAPGSNLSFSYRILVCQFTVRQFKKKQTVFEKTGVPPEFWLFPAVMCSDEKSF